MKIIRSFLSIFSLFVLSNSNESCVYDEEKTSMCVSFSVSSGTGCAWMCNYCATQLGTNNYYFTDNVCTYQPDEGCVGNPISGKPYVHLPAWAPP